MLATMDEPKYKIHAAGDGTFSVEVYGGEGEDAEFRTFQSEQSAKEWIEEEKRKQGIAAGWSTDSDDE